MVKRVLRATLIALHGLKGVFLETRPSSFAQNDHLKPKLFLCCLFAMKRVRCPLFNSSFLPVRTTQKIYLKEEKIWIVEVVNFR